MPGATQAAMVCPGYRVPSAEADGHLAPVFAGSEPVTAGSKVRAGALPHQPTPVRARRELGYCGAWGCHGFEGTLVNPSGADDGSSEAGEIASLAG
ncbi:MAG: hypothetical protein ACRDQI_01110 [Pseudonocardiaceae bacterium]